MTSDSLNLETLLALELERWFDSASTIARNWIDFRNEAKNLLHTIRSHEVEQSQDTAHCPSCGKQTLGKDAILHAESCGGADFPGYGILTAEVAPTGQSLNTSPERVQETANVGHDVPQDLVECVTQAIRQEQGNPHMLTHFQAATLARAALSAMRSVASPAIDIAKADEHTTREIADVFCSCYMTDGFCTPRNREGCRCQRIAKTATEAIRSRRKFTRPEVAALAAIATSPEPEKMEQTAP